MRRRCLSGRIENLLRLSLQPPGWHIGAPRPQSRAAGLRRPTTRCIRALAAAQAYEVTRPRVEAAPLAGLPPSVGAQDGDGDHIITTFRWPAALDGNEVGVVGKSHDERTEPLSCCCRACCLVLPRVVYGLGDARGAQEEPRECRLYQEHSSGARHVPGLLELSKLGENMVETAEV